MTKNRLYIFSNTILKQKDKSIYLESSEELPEDSLFEGEIMLGSGAEELKGENKKHIPVEAVDSILTFGTVNFNSRFLYFLSRNEIPLHIFTYSGGYSGSFMPSSRYVAGKIFISQSTHFLDMEKRLFIAKQFTLAASKNSLSNMKYHNRRHIDLSVFIEPVEELTLKMENAGSIQELMGYEGQIKKNYYCAWRYILRNPHTFTSRVKNPPDNLINSLISYGNMIVYSACLDQIYQTRLYPEIGFLHEAGDSKLSLSYDIAEIFKPLITDRVIFKVINKGIITENDCFVKDNKCIIKKEAKKKFVEEFEIKFRSTLTPEGENRSRSYCSLIRQECYKLIEHLEGINQYESYISRW
ncbi:MAG: type I-B CRISPR-associated endonuclease Cas1 [Ignavibacteriaceae bacterium]|nr:type I-B CRISPR-associated endonuclease Cas1 [Ignavibacteriaceae bacterium]